VLQENLVDKTAAETISAEWLHTSILRSTAAHAFDIGPGDVAIFADCTENWVSAALHAPAIRWRESDNTNIAGMRGSVDTNGDATLVLGTGWLSTKLTLRATDLHTMSGSLTLTGNLDMSSVTPIFTLDQTGGAVDNKKWRMLAVSESLRLQLQNDAETVTTTFMQVDRTGTTVDNIALNGAITVAGRTNLDDDLYIRGGGALGVFDSLDTSYLWLTHDGDDVFLLGWALTDSSLTSALT
jgi:hypothetical protein